MNIGKAIKKLRENKNMTQAELAKLSGINFTTISKIEKSTFGGTIKIHQKIAKGLGVSLPDLYRELDKPLPPAYEINEIKENPVTNIFYYDKGAVSQILVKQLSGRRMLPENLCLEVDKTTHLEEKPEGTDQFILVLEGSIEIKIESGILKLKKGQTIYFDASKPHIIRNVGKNPAKCLRVTSPGAL